MTVKNSCVLACDMGGSSIKAACVLEDGTIAGDTLMIPSHSDGPLESILDSWEETLTALLSTAGEMDLTVLGIGVSTPGPFDYSRKMSLMKHKFQSIYGIDLEKKIRGRIGLPDVPFRFVQDTNSHLLGEQHFGAAQGIHNCACVTLGTGLGMSAMADGRLLSNGRDSSYIAIYRQPYGGGILEDIVSARGVCAAYRKLTGNTDEISAKEVGIRARQGEETAMEVWTQFGEVLGRGVAFHLIHTWSELLVVGGQISRDLCLFEDSLTAALRKDGFTGPVLAARFPDDAALYGVAAMIINLKTHKEEYTTLPCCVRLKEAMDTFSPMEQQVASFIMSFPAEIPDMSIEELAKACNTSVSSVVRLCKSANYNGYKDFLRVLSTDLVIHQSKDVTYSDIKPGDSVESIARNVYMSHIQTIENTLSVLELDELQKAVDAICRAKRVDFYGTGTSGIVATDAQSKFIRIGKISMSSSDSHQQLLTAALLGKNDVAVLISYSGDTRDIVELADVIRRTPATIISLTRCSGNELSRKADIRLYCSSSELLVRSGAMNSRIGSMSVIDALYTSVTSSQYQNVKECLDKTHLATARKRLHFNLD